MRDPYQVLGVPRGASDEEVKRAYRRLAKRFHPDVNSGSSAAEQQFRELGAAYDLLSDPARRQRFDRGEIDAEGRERRAPFRQARRSTFAEGFSLDDMVQEFLRGGRRAAGARRKEEPAEPVAKQPLSLSFLEAALGGKRPVTLADGRTVEVAIPVGIDSGQKLRLRHGEVDESLIEITVEPHPVFTRKERDIHVEIAVTLSEAVLGASITVPTIHGDVTLKVPRGSNSGSVLRLRGKGIANPAHGGDQYVRLKVVLPDPPDPALSAFLEAWAPQHPYRVRGNLDPS
jgi:DnaJ-class molecular chaperone